MRLKKLSEFSEAVKDTVVFSFGRFNPPTIGHEKVIDTVKKIAGSNPFRIYPSHTVGPKDPLSHTLKTAYLRKIFPKYKNNIVVSKARNAIDIAVELYDEGFKNIIMVVGSDRLAVFTKMLNQYNGVEGKKHGYYKFDSLEVVSAGRRDPDAEGV